MHENYWQAAAAHLGMKRSEITDLHQVGDGVVVTTHDGQRTLVTAQGVAGPWTGELPAAPPVEVDEKPVGGGQGDELDDNTELEGAEGDGEQGDGEPEPVPDGTTAEVLAWVGEDPERARRALGVETGKAKPRAGLVGELEKLAQR